MFPIVNLVAFSSVHTTQAFETFTAVLQWLTGSSGGSFILVSWLVAWVIEKFDFWKKLDSVLKSMIILMLSGILGSASVFLLSKPDIVAMIDPYFRPFMYAVAAWLTTQAAHKSDPDRK